MGDWVEDDLLAHDAEDAWQCEWCNGTGQLMPDCEECEGNGWVEDPNGGTMTCPACDDTKCERCGGSGEKDDH